MAAPLCPTPVPTEVVPLGEVERELSRQLKALQSAGQVPFVHARMSNLVIFCDSAELAASVAEQIPGIVALHPARILLLIGNREAPTEDVTAVPCARVHKVETKQVWSEQVTLRAGGAAVDRLPFAVRALLIGELPTNIWWASLTPPPLAGMLLHDLGESAQQIIYDSIGWRDPARGVAATASWLEQVDRSGSADRWRTASDINWRRLKYWRRLLGQALDPGSAPGALESINEVLIEHGPHAVVKAWELASWLAQRLHWRVLTGKVAQNVEISWRFYSEHGDLRVRIQRHEQGPPTLARVRIACTINGKPAALNMTTEENQRLAVNVEGPETSPRTMAVPERSLADLIGRQLSDRERDPVFRESMAVAQVLARSLLR